MSKVRFNVPNFFKGDFPEDGSPVTENIILNGDDGTRVTIFAGSNMIYTEKPEPYFESNIQPSGSLYKFVFPLKTEYRNSTQFTTPKNSVYIFSKQGSLGIDDDGKATKLVTGGTIDIKPPSEISSIVNKAEGSAEKFGKQVDALIDNSALLESSIAARMNDLLTDEDSPFYSISLIIYKLFMDFIVIVIFWILFVSIGIWLKLPSRYLYPVDVTQFPYVYYDGSDSMHYNMMQKDGTRDHICKEISKNEVKAALDRQRVLFNEMDEALAGDNKEIMRIVYPQTINRGESSIPRFSSMLLEKCAKTDLCTMDYITYFIGTLALYNYISCNTVLGGIHNVFSFIKDKIGSNLDTKIVIVVFAIILYYLYLTVGEVSKTVSRMFNINIEKGTDIQSMMVENFYRLLLSLLSVIMSVAIPICSVLIITCLLTTVYVLAKTCLFPYNFALLFLAFISLYFSMTQYIAIIKHLISSVDPLSLLEKIYVKEINIQTIASFLGITMPILFGFAYGGYTSFNLFVSFFQFLRRDEVKQTMKTTSASVVIVGLMLLLFHVKDILGNTFLFMTIMIIVLVGLYMLSKTS